MVKIKLHSKLFTTLKSIILSLALWLINEELNVRWIFWVSDLAAGGSHVNNSEMKPAEWEHSNKNNESLHVYIPEFPHAAAGEAAGPRTSYRCTWNIKEPSEMNSLVCISSSRQKLPQETKRNGCLESWSSNGERETVAEKPSWWENLRFLIHHWGWATMWRVLNVWAVTCAVSRYNELPQRAEGNPKKTVWKLYSKSLYTKIGLTEKNIWYKCIIKTDVWLITFVCTGRLKRWNRVV